MRADLVGELVDLKRVHSPAASESLAGRRFLGAWAALCAGEDARDVALRETAAAVCACRLGAIDAPVLERAGLDEAAIAGIAARALDAVEAPDALREWATLAPPADQVGGSGRSGIGFPGAGAPIFARALAAQPRAGATRPGHARLMLAPAESHAEHCWVVAVAAVLAAFEEDADVAVAFLAGLAHHAHNAALPDAGFTGEMLLGEHLDAVLSSLREQALAELPEALRASVSKALAATVDASTPEGRAFHTADVLDRVLEMRWHARTADFTLDEALDELDLVHEGPLQAFGLQVVADAGLR